MNYTELLKSMEVHGATHTLPSDAYTTLCGTRQRLKTKLEFRDWHWKFTIAGDEVIVTRTR